MRKKEEIYSTQKTKTQILHQKHKQKVCAETGVAKYVDTVFLSKQYKEYSNIITFFKKASWTFVFAAQLVCRPLGHTLNGEEWSKGIGQVRPHKTVLILGESAARICSQKLAPCKAHVSDVQRFQLVELGLCKIVLKK